MSEEPVIIPLDELREKLCMVPIDVLRQVLHPQGLRVLRSDEVPPQGAIIIPPGRGKATREGLHKALDCIVAAWVGTWRPPLDERHSLTKTSIMDLMLWAAAWKNAEGGN